MQRCLQIRDACGEAIAWIDANRGKSPRLDQESANLTLHLRRARNRARALARAADRPFSVGFFGLSQAGKSYLISALAADPSGRLDLAVGTGHLNFLTHVNPPGGGKEATGLVTRLTPRARAAPAGFPVRLHLLSAADLVKVLANAFHNNFDHEHRPAQVEGSTPPRQPDALTRKRQPRPVPGMDADDLVAIQDYVEQQFPNRSSLPTNFWATAGSLVTYLDADDRAELFAPLWGGVRELTETFQLLCQALARLGFASAVDCESAALAPGPTADGEQPVKSLVDVACLDRLGRDLDDSVMVLPDGAAGPADAVRVPRSVLAALTAEIELALAAPPKAELLGQVDLLDFPGYRGPLAIADLADDRGRLREDQLDPVAQLVLRGKVSYLFERYTEDQSMNALVLCAPSNQQIDVRDLDKVIGTWINSTQGPDPVTRALHRPGLLWALTKFDQRLDVVPGQTPEAMRDGWEGLINLALLERFGNSEWLREWTPGQCFDNLFLVRKPGKAGAVIRTEGEQELELIDGQRERLARLRQTFCEHPAIRKYIREPQVAWDAMLSLNDGGMSRLMEHLTRVLDQDARLRHIRDQADNLAADMANTWLKRFHSADGLAAAADKRSLVRGIVEPLAQRPNRIGDLIFLLQPSRETLRALYMPSDLKVDGSETARPVARSSDSAISLGEIFDEGRSEVPGRPLEDRATRFTQDAMQSWVAQLSGLAEQASLQAYFGLSRERFKDLVNELVTGADRHGLADIIAAALREWENQGGIKPEHLVWRQVDAVYFVLCAYVDRLEAFEPRSEGAGANGRPKAAGPAASWFAPPPPIATGQVPDLSPAPEPFTTRYITDWFRALLALAENNAGHQVGQEIPADQNRRLGKILMDLAGEEHATAATPA